ncbi:MAG: hypothetical protein EOP51_04945 [Sphingobacteriales bacterium]|nr:MAG: hypothetical protein EOP51_04945 [Sphingobacteriales bacterium]
MEFEEFKEKVKEIVPGKRWYHVLPAVSPNCRERFLALIQVGVIMPKAYDLIEKMKDYRDEDFQRHVQVIKDSKL